MRPGNRGRARSLTQRYLSYPYSGQLIRLPAIHIRLRDRAGGSIKTLALVDSGATSSFIPAELAQLFNVISEADSIQAAGGGGSFETWVGRLTVEALKGNNVHWKKFMRFHIPVKEDMIPYVILGRDSVFLTYDVLIRERQQLLKLKLPGRKTRKSGRSPLSVL